MESLMAQSVQTRYKIHEVAERIKLSVSGIRKKENLGEFPPSRRDERNWRYYTEEDVLKLQAYFLEKDPGKRGPRKRGTKL
jgi:hypothetical protein